jgi:hypothetical protein
MDRSYFSYVQTLAARKPSLGPLAQSLLETDEYGETSKTIRYLEVRRERVVPFQENDLEHVLDKISEFKELSKVYNTGLCILVEDIHSSEVSSLGASPEVDPRFFRDHFSKSYFPIPPLFFPPPI